MRTPPPQLLLLGSIGSVQFGAAFADKLFAQAGPAGVVLLRLLISAVVLLSISRPSLRGRSRHDLAAAAVFGLILGTMNWSFYEALDRLPLGPAVTIELLGPLAVACAGSRRRLDGLWLVLATGGVLLLALGGRGGQHDRITVAGVLLALVAAVCWAAYIFASKRVGSVFDQLDGLAIALAVGALLVLPAGLIQGGTTLLRPSVFFGGCAVALLSSLIPYSLDILALRRLSPATFGLLMSLEPAMAALAGVLVLGQNLSTVLVVALIMVVLASAGASLTSPTSSIDDALLG